MIELGDKVQDIVTRFKGIAMARASWLNGCDRIAVQPQELSRDGDIQDATWIDEPQLNIIKKAATEKKKPVKKTGGPHSKKF